MAALSACQGPPAPASARQQPPSRAPAAAGLAAAAPLQALSRASRRAGLPSQAAAPTRRGGPCAAAAGPATAAPGVAAPATPRLPLPVKVRTAGVEECAAIAAIFAEAFSAQPNASASEGAGLDASDWRERLERALSIKAAAAADSRRWRLARAAHIAAVEAARRAGAPDPRVPGITKAVRQQLQRWRRQRAFVILVAEDRLTGEVLGSAAVSLAQPEAALPPPFPTVKPRRAYVSNIAVRSGWRRHGVATALLQQCERQARLWRNDSLWLHVEVNNEAALLLYERQGYEEVQRECVSLSLRPRRCLMKKPVEPCPRPLNNIVANGRGSGSGSGSSSGSSSVASASTGSSGGMAASSSSSSSSKPSAGVYVWGDEVDGGGSG